MTYYFSVVLNSVFKMLIIANFVFLLQLNILTRFSQCRRYHGRTCQNYNSIGIISLMTSRWDLIPTTKTLRPQHYISMVFLLVRFNGTMKKVDYCEYWMPNLTLNPGWNLFLWQWPINGKLIQNYFQYENIHF